MTNQNTSAAELTAEITITRRRSDGIYKSDGGGQEVVWYRETGGAKTVFDALHRMRRDVAADANGFGPYGVGQSWVTVAGVRINDSLGAVGFGTVAAETLIAKCLEGADAYAAWVSSVDKLRDAYEEAGGFDPYFNPYAPNAAAEVARQQRFAA